MIGGGGIVDLGADDRVWANHDALAALDAKLLVPHRNFQRDVSLLPLRGAGGEGPVDGHGADRDEVAVAGNHQAFDVAHKLGSVGWHRRARLALSRSALPPF